MIKFQASDIVIIISPLHNNNNNNNNNNIYVYIYIHIYIYKYKCVGVCWISINNTLDILLLCTLNTQEARWPSFEFNFTIIIPVL